MKEPAKQMSELVGNAAMFPILRAWHFFNHAGVSPLPGVAADVMRAYADHAEAHAYLGASWFKEIEQLRVTSAAMINAHRDEIAFVKNTSEGLSIVAGGIDWKPGDVIVTTAVEYPANIYPWMEVQRRTGAKLVMVAEEESADGSRSVPIEKILAAADTARARMITLSHVEFASGQRHDLMRMGSFCADRGILLCIDAIQSMGVWPIDVRAMHIDYLSADGHKWLLGPEGAGIFYCRRELLDRTRPGTIGWMNVIDAENYGNYNYTLRPDAGRFECGSYNVPGLLALKASMDLLLNAGVVAVGDRITRLTGLFAEGIQRKGYRVISPREQGQGSGIVSFVSENVDMPAIITAMRKEHRVELALREGRMRCSPHFYNTEEQLARVVELLPGL